MSDLEILFVDDDTVTLKALSGLLRRLPNLHVDTAESADAALGLLAKRRYDIVLCDYDLGKGATGEAVLNAASPGADTVLVTGSIGDLSALGFRVLEKPFRFEVLEALIKEIQERRAADDP